jgi:hypothetical protein
MKLLFCPNCRDVHGLVQQEWRLCICMKSGGQYNRDGMTATIGGQGRVFGVGNPFFDYLYQFLEPEGKKRMWKSLYGHTDGDVWWGEYSGDKQIFRIESPLGPVIKIKVKRSSTPGNNIVYVVDSRKVYQDGLCEHGFNVLVPSNPNTKVRYNEDFDHAKWVMSK